MTAYGQELDRAVNIQLLVERIKQEAEDMEQFTIMISAEVLALADLYMDNYYDISMYPEVLEFPNADYVAVGQVAKTEEDFDDDIYGYIIPKSYMKDGQYIVEYRIIWKYM